MSQPQRVGADCGECQIIADINEFGWHATHVLEGDGFPPWSFTIGLYETWRQPELIIIGRSRATAQFIFEKIADDLDRNDHLDIDPTGLERSLGIPSRLIEVDERYYQDYVGFARWFYGRRPFPMLQIVWPNHHGQYPWDADAPTSLKEWQPVLGKPS